jgi:hypothetical protein
MAAVIVSDEDRVWYVFPSGKAREASYVRGQSGGPSQAEKLIARLEGRNDDESGTPITCDDADRLAPPTRPAASSEFRR